MQMANKCESWKVSNGKEGLAFQALQFQQTFCHKFTGAGAISRYQPNLRFVQIEFNVPADSSRLNAE
jgi:hypothetical protein